MIADRFVARAMNATVKLLAGGVSSVVAGGGDDDDAGVHQFAHREAERINFVRVDRRRADAEVDDANLVLLVVLLAQRLIRIDGREYPLQRLQDVGG